jgi:kynurenine formamidase
MNAKNKSERLMVASSIRSELGAFRVVDLTAPLNDRTACYPTDPPFAKSWHVHFGDQGYCVSKLEMGAHTGTHVDAPMHFLGDAFPAVAEISLQTMIGHCIALNRPKQAGEDLDIGDLAGADILSGDIVLFRTGWDKRSGSPAFFQDEWPGLRPSLVEELIRRGVKALGGDIASVDSPTALAAGAPAHKLAARAGMPVFEALVNLEQVTGQRFFFLGLPLKLERCEASPVRAVALIPQANFANNTPA